MASQDDPGFWVRHPIGRGFASGVGHWLFTCRTQLAKDSYSMSSYLRQPSGMWSHLRASFVCGGAMGLISGVTNVLLHPILKEAAKKQPDDTRQVIKFFGNTIPWATSFGVMSVLQTHGKFPGLYRFDRRAGAVIAIWGALCDQTNDDILSPRMNFDIKILVGGWW